MKAELKTSELRLGNYIQVEGKISKIDGIQPHWVWFDNISSSNMDDIEPISLDEAWLIKMGFEKRGDTGQYFIGNQTISINDNGYMFWLGDSGFGKLIKTVHQLQNIYFTMNETELTVSE